MAVPLCNAELGCCGSLYSTGATRNGNPDRCCDRGFSLFASSTQPPLRFGDDAEDLLSNRRMIKKPRFLMRGDTI